MTLSKIFHRCMKMSDVQPWIIFNKGIKSWISFCMEQGNNFNNILMSKKFKISTRPALVYPKSTFFTIFVCLRWILFLFGSTAFSYHNEDLTFCNFAALWPLQFSVRQKVLFRILICFKEFYLLMSIYQPKLGHLL